MVQEILWLRCLAVAAQAVCLVALARRRLARRYPVFWVFTLCGLLQSVWALDGEEAAAFRWVFAVICGAVAIEACLVQARHFRSLFSFAVDAILAFIVLAAALGGTICLTGADVLRDPGPVMLMCAGCCVLLILSTAFFSTFPVTMRANVRWHVLLLLILLAGQAVAAALGSLESADGHVAAQFLAAACPLVCYTLWSIKLVPSGECFLPLSEIPAEVLARLMAQEPQAPAPAAPEPPRRPPAARGGSGPRLRWTAGTAPPERKREA
jgi:hypothetical protein